MHREFIEKLEVNPVIAAIKDDEGLAHALETDCEIIFILYGDVCTIPDIVQKIKSVDKVAMVHLDLITGLNNTKEISWAGIVFQTDPVANSVIPICS